MSLFLKQNQRKCIIMMWHQKVPGQVIFKPNVYLSFKYHLLRNRYVVQQYIGPNVPTTFGIWPESRFS